MTEKQAIRILLESKNGINHYDSAQINAAYYTFRNQILEWYEDDDTNEHYLEIINRVTLETME